MRSGVTRVAEKLNLQESFRLSDRSSVFLAEVLAVCKANVLVRSVSVPLQRAAIATDSMASIMSLNSPVFKSELVK